MHVITSEKRKKFFMPLLKLSTWLCPRFPKTMTWIRYVARQKKFPNFWHPKNLNEKILYLSMNTDTSEWSRLADKYAVREYVEQCGLKDTLVSLYGVWDDVYDIDFSALPNSFVLKTTFGSGDVVVVKDKATADLEAIKARVHKYMNEYILTGGAELHYTRIPRRVIAEEKLINDELSEKYSSTLIDYKIWVFNGRARYIWVCMNRFVRNKDGAEVMTYDRNWEAHPEYCRVTPDFSLAEPMPKPENYEHMLEVAEKLAAPFPVVRVDLYNLAGKIYFGEMTFTSYGGIMDFYSEEFLKLAGNEVDISNLMKQK